MIKIAETTFVSKQTLSSGQFQILASFCKELAQTSVIGAFGVLIIPEAFGLENKVSLLSFSFLVLAGLTSLLTAVILTKKGEK